MYQTPQESILSLILVIIYKPSILVVPEFAYNNAEPNRIKHELKPKAVGTYHANKRPILKIKKKNEFILFTLTIHIFLYSFQLLFLKS